MDLEFSVAGPADEKAIRSLLADTPMPGAVTVSFIREPDYFAGESVMGERCVTLKAVNRANGELAAIICLASTHRYIRGESRAIGYIGQLRIAEAYQGYMIPLRSVPFIRQTIKNGWPETWFVVIADENPEALSIFAEHPRASLPSMVRVSGITTSAVLTASKQRRCGKKSPPKPGLVSGERIGMKQIVKFLREEGPRYEFFPLYGTDAFSAHFGVSERRFPGLTPSNFIVAEAEGRITGVCAVWDQSPFKQTVVHGYRGMLRRVRPVYNMAAPLLGVPRLPAAGSHIRSSYLSFLSVRHDDRGVADALIARAVRVAHDAGKDYVMVGLADSHPLLSTVQRYRRITYRSCMYAFRFDGHPPDFDATKSPHVEIGML